MKNEQYNYLMAQIKAQLVRLDGSVWWYRRRHYITKGSTIVLSTLITVISGISLPPDIISPGKTQALILIFGATISIITTFGSFFSPKESWLLGASTYDKLRKLQFELEFKSKAFAEDANECPFIDDACSKYQAIIDEYNVEWFNLRTNEKTG
jgi:Protein of unknown function (DUF4231)